MGQPLFTLDEHRAMSAKTKITITVALIAYVALTAFMLTIANKALAELPWVPITYSFMFAAIAITTALLLFGQAQTTRLRGYMWLANGYLYIGLLNGATPLFWDNAFLLPGGLLGGGQGASYLGWMWVWFFPAGFAISGWLLRDPAWDRARYRGSLTVKILLGVVAALASILFAAVVSPHLPVMVIDGDTLTGLNITIGYFWLFYALAAMLFAIGMALRFKTVIHYWMAWVMVIIMGHAVVGVVVQRWSAGWYYNRVMTLISASILLFLLLWNIFRINQATNRAATHDQLTNVASRISLTKGIDNSIAGEHLCYLLWVNIDDFRSFTTATGQVLGDEALRGLASRLVAVVGGQGTVGRLGNAEFGITINNAGDTSDNSSMERRIDVIADAILRAGREPIILHEVPTWFTWSIGIAAAPRDAHTTAELLQHADLAAQASRNAHNNQCEWYTKSMSVTQVEKEQLRQQLNQSVQDEAFDLDYQPIVTRITGELMGVEALIRWLHDGERISAGRFIGVAEEFGQIVSIGRIMAKRLQADINQLLARLPAAGFVTYNLSVLELADHELMDILISGPLVAQSQHLVAEITESQELENSTPARHNLARLRTAGYRIAIDDFGTGFSSFSLIRDIQPHILKIDRSIVAAAAATAASREFLTGVIDIARGLGCDVLAEGIEDTAEETAMLSLDVDYLQGYRYGRPDTLAAIQPRSAWKRA